MRTEIKAVLFLLVAVFLGIALPVACDKRQEQPTAVQSKPAEVKAEAESFESVTANFAGLTLVRPGVYDSGTGIAVILTTETGDAGKALAHLIGRRGCWQEKFPERAKRIRNEMLAHRTFNAMPSGYNSSWGNTLPHAIVITYEAN